MTWPTVADYDAAVSDLKANCRDGALASAQLKLDTSGRPVAYRGRSTVVYLARVNNLRLAMRCFLQPRSDRSHRYQLIDRELAALKLPCLANFAFVDEALRVGLQTVPIVKMEWLDGELLHRYLERNLNYGEHLRQLADSWLAMSKTMRKAGIAHGNLEHTNIMVRDGAFKLVDYDGFYVPGLKGFPAHDTGLEHYQHRRRKVSHFGPFIDNFSDWVIYTTILALSRNPALWSKVDLGRKHMIFSRTDFENPETSETFITLKNTSDKLRLLATSLQNLLSYEVEDIPELKPEAPVPPAIARVAIETAAGARITLDIDSTAQTQSKFEPGAGRGEAPEANPPDFSNEKLPSEETSPGQPAEANSAPKISDSKDVGVSLGALRKLGSASGSQARRAHAEPQAKPQPPQPEGTPAQAPPQSSPQGRDVGISAKSGEPAPDSAQWRQTLADEEAMRVAAVEELPFEHKPVTTAGASEKPDGASKQVAFAILLVGVVVFAVLGFMTWQNMQVPRRDAPAPSVASSESDGDKAGSKAEPQSIDTSTEGQPLSEGLPPPDGGLKEGVNKTPPASPPSLPDENVAADKPSETPASLPIQPAKPQSRPSRIPPLLARPERAPSPAGITQLRPDVPRIDSNRPTFESPSRPAVETPSAPSLDDSFRQAVSGHPLASRIGAVEQAVDGMHSRGVDTTTYTHQLDEIKTLVVQGDSSRVDGLLKKLEYRLGLRASAN